MYDITVIILEGSFGSSVAATLDILRAASAIAPRVGAPIPRWRICSVDGGPVRLHLGLLVETTKLPRRVTSDRSVWVVPGIGVDNKLDVHTFQERQDVQTVVGALQAHARKGGRIAAGCSAVFLLELAGLLKGRRVTTAWWLAPILQQMNPDCQVEADKMVCSDGYIVTAGAAFAQKDLMLHILTDLCGAKLVDLLSRFLLVDARDAQSQYVIPEVLASGDELVAKIVARIEEGLPEMPSISELAVEFLISERTLARHVKKATGKNPTALLQAIRLRKARTLLEQSRMSVEDIAAAVGYGDSTALRRLMRKTTGNSPRQYRR
jgi:transcriptional regulator GlxA family with amidase domain